MTLRRNRLVAWIAALAVMLQALWPLLSHARPKDPSILVPVCTIDGITHYLEIKSGRSPLDERTAQHGDHCKLCVFGDGKVFVPVPDLSSFIPVRNPEREIAAPAVSFHKPFHIFAARPRAPPQAS